MKRYYYAISFLFLLGGSTSLVAQTMPPLEALLLLFDTESENTFTTQLDGLTTDFLTDRTDGLRLDDLDLSATQDSLWYYLGQDGFPAQPNDSLQELFWRFNSGELQTFLNNDTLAPADSTTLSSTFDSLAITWFSNNDSLANIQTNPLPALPNFERGGSAESTTDGANTRWEAFQGNWTQTYRLLYNELIPTAESTENGGLNDLQNAADNGFFSSALDFEIAYGQSWNEVRFYRESYRTQSNVIRIASVPDYNNRLQIRWGLEGSFFFERENQSSDDGVNLLEGLNPLHYNGNAALVFLPEFGSIGSNGSFRLYTSIGMDLGTYVPAHANNNSLIESNRVGKTTGFGPQIGAGFAINYSDLSIYSYGTVATGSVVNDLGLNYNYNSAALNAGVRFGDAINATFTSGVASWAPKEGKRIAYSRFTIGIILDELIP